MHPPVERRVSRLSLASIQPARFVGILTGMALMLYGAALPAAPREVLPPWPEPTLGIWGFNHWHTPMLPGRTVVGIEAAQVAESWSGYALVRDGLSPSPVAIPVLEPANGSRNFASDQGTIRFWFRPDWSSATQGGQGPRDYVRLLELVALGGKEPQVVWSLYLNPEGTAAYLSGQGVGGPMDFLKAEVNWTAGQWRMLALAYDGGGTTLTVDRAAVAVGPPLPPVATWQRDALALVVGSALSGAGMAQGEFEELCTFDHAVALKDLAFYWRGQRRWVALGPVGTVAEEAAKLATLDKRMQMMTLASGTLASAGEETEPAEGPLPEMSYASREYLPGELWLEMLGVTNGVAWVKLHGTEAGEWYELQSREDLVTGPGWQVAGPLWPGSEEQDCTLAMVTTGGRTNLFLRARSWVDADGNGLPDWWEQEVFGQAGVDPYGDPDGDGWVNLQEYQNGTNPNAFNPPPGPTPFTAALNSEGTSVNLHWQPSPGPVTHYIVERSDPILDEWGWPDDWTVFAPIAQVDGAARSFADAGAFVPRNYTENFIATEGGALGYPNHGSVYRIRAGYANGYSTYSTAEMDLPPPTQQMEAWWIRNANARWTLAVAWLPENTTQIRLHWHPEYESAHESFTFGVSNIVGGFYPVPDSLVTNLQGRITYCQPLAADGTPGHVRPLGSISSEIPCMADGREHLRQNLVFLLRAAPLASPYYWSEWNAEFPKHHEEAGFLTTDAVVHDGVLDVFSVFVENRQPFEWNHWFRNYLLETNDPAPLHVFNWNGDFSQPVPAPPLLAGGEPFWISQDYLFPPVTFAFFSLWPEWLARFGVMLSTNEGPAGTFTYSMTMAASVAHNWWGLPVYSGLGVDTEGVAIDPETGFPYPVPAQYQTLSPGATISWSPRPPARYYSRIAEPQFAPLGYYFAPVGERWTVDGRREPLAPLPTFPNFAPTNPIPPLLAAVGKKLTVGGWAKLGITNGYADKLAYLGQYFDRPYKVGSNGLPTLDESGVLSPYGEFFPVEAGRFDLTTMDDGISPSPGWCRVHVVKLALDVNRDGEMDLTWNGPDNTSPNRPMVFWVNNDYDRGHAVNLIDFEEDDLGPTEVMKLPPNDRFPDYGIMTATGNRAIPCKRDLEDYARLWVAGLRHLYLANTNLDFELSIVGSFGDESPAINVVRAVEPDGGTRYLFEETAAEVQTNAAAIGYLRRVSPSQPLRLNDLFDPITGPNDYYLFCGAARGKGELVLRVLQSTNVLLETSQWIELKDIKEMYERWTVGDRGAEPPAEAARLAVEDLPAGTTAFRYEPSSDPNAPYILHVHGWNMQRWEKDRFAETAFKRLYWQGYQGRFGSFRWPTYYDWPFTFQTFPTAHFDQSEFNAWKSASPLRALLEHLNLDYPGQVRLTAHSMANIVAGEALRTHTPLVHTYVAMQAAVPAHAYDPGTPTRTIGLFGGADNSTPNRHAFYWTNGAPCYFANAAGSTRFVNFFNEEDWALQAWRLDQDFKPQTALGYGFSSGPSDPEQYSRGFDLLAFPADTFEIFSFITEARCYALGAQNNVGGVYQINQQFQQSDLNALPHEFGLARKGHSGQFRSTNMKRNPFWGELLDRLGISGNP